MSRLVVPQRAQIRLPRAGGGCSEARWPAAGNQVLEHVAFEKEYMLCRCTQVQRTATWRVFSREMFISAE